MKAAGRKLARRILVRLDAEGKTSMSAPIEVLTIRTFDGNSTIRTFCDIMHGGCYWPPLPLSGVV